MAKKALLMILDGWGIGQHGKGDVIYNTPTPYLDYLTAVSAHSQLMASGEDVGLPDGQMGNSEVGHLKYRCRSHRISGPGKDQPRLQRRLHRGEPAGEGCLYLRQGEQQETAPDGSYL